MPQVNCSKKFEDTGTKYFCKVTRIFIKKTEAINNFPGFFENLFWERETDEILLKR